MHLHDFSSVIQIFILQLKKFVYHLKRAQNPASTPNRFKKILIELEIMLNPANMYLLKKPQNISYFFHTFHRQIMFFKRTTVHDKDHTTSNKNRLTQYPFELRK